jgi:hypothetical protein
VQVLTGGKAGLKGSPGQFMEPTVLVNINKTMQASLPRHRHSVITVAALLLPPGLPGLDTAPGCGMV